jgi:copper homeostasis protein (lipoprotein)
MVLRVTDLLGCARIHSARCVMRVLVAIACASILVGCARDESPSDTAPTANAQAADDPASLSEAVSIEPLPALYSGVLPCADCAGIRYEVDLRPGNVYFLRMTYLDEVHGRHYDDLGAWSLASDLRTLALRSSRQEPILFSIVDPGTIRKLDMEGQPIESELNYDLDRADAYTPISPVVPLRGMYSVTDDGAAFEECTTGLRLRLEGEQAAALQQEFERLRKSDSAALLLAVEAQVNVPTDAGTATISPTSPAKFWPGEACGVRGVTHELEGSRWVLVRIGAESFVPREGRPEPYIVLQPSTKQAVGHAGCNRLAGAYRIEGSSLSFGELATTRMACPDLDTEHAFLDALDNVARWKLEDNQLVLLNERNEPLLQLEARNL